MSVCVSVWVRLGVFKEDLGYGRCFFRQQTALRRGLFCARDLFDWQGEDYPLLDKVCVVRFPPEIAATLRQRLINAATAATSPEGTALACPGADLGLSFTPRPDFNHRIFDVKVGVRLLEASLPLCLLLSLQKTRAGRCRRVRLQVSGHHGRLRGVLVELPALVEAYKCIDGDLLYKSGGSTRSQRRAVVCKSRLEDSRLAGRRRRCRSRVHGLCAQGT